MIIQLRIYRHDYTRDVSITPYYTFRQLIHDFTLWISSTRFSTRRWTMFIDELDVNELPDSILSSSIRDWVVDPSPIIFEELETSDTSNFVMSLVPNRLNAFDNNVIRNFQNILDQIALQRNRITQQLDRLRTNGPGTLRNRPLYTPYMAHLQQFLEPGNMEVGFTMRELNPDDNIFNNIFDLINNGNFMQNFEEQTNIIVAMKKEVFDNLEEEDASLEDKCTICMLSFEEGDKCKKIECKHQFHIDCLSQWLTECSIKCPLCRTELTKDDSEKNYIH